MRDNKDYDLEDRLIDYSVRIINISEALPDTRAGRHVSGQLLRSGTSPAPNYGEAQSAESRKDFIHTIKIALKEMRESLVWLKVVRKAGWITPLEKIEPLLKETDELIAILFSSAETARKNDQR